jgi:ATP-binding cassette, subfamily G (WHITE), member 2, PDR
MTAVVCALHLLAAQYIPAQRSKGDMVRFRHAGKEGNLFPDPEKAVPLGLPKDTSYQIRKGPIPNGGKIEVGKLSIQEQASIFHWKDLSYEVRSRNWTNRILNSIDGWVKPGTLTALMVLLAPIRTLNSCWYQADHFKGVTGAGKTTLLDVLAERASFGSATGSICVDGAPRDASFQRKIGYVQQEDIHLPTATVREALQFSADLRKTDNTLEKDTLDDVNSIIKILDMNSFADAVVGIPGDG